MRYAPFISTLYLSCPSSSSALPPCPVPLYYFPRPHPFSSSATIPARLPRHLRHSTSNRSRTLKVRIPNLWALCLQMYESDDEPRTYAAFTTYLATDGEVRYDTVAPWGSGWDLARDCFRVFFRLRTGVAWEERNEDGDAYGKGAGACDWKRERDAERKRALSQDGAGDFVYVPQSKAKAKGRAGLVDLRGRMAGNPV